ncbi:MULTISPECIES: ankyrin repeat domain-containing protein [Legionella]|uniref:Ankyrin repeat protein n=1 Tax=Legionella drozanskii LLAP-1 TaxID=1212489 RepID=A0A0W0TBX2_9GAMM|nr:MULTISPECIES: ankyrin repeat domain-containing protein [Legionella]KTC93086.1 Ankyrin repeat protein [Legionella drozanskii LLAP-1]PJE11988.1 MAG: hypothetical protein CK430_08455 [Legionella sp.]
MVQSLDNLEKKIDARLERLHKTRAANGLFENQAESIVFHYYLKQLAEHQISIKQHDLVHRIELSGLVAIKVAIRLDELEPVLKIAIRENDKELLEALTERVPNIVDLEFKQSKKTALIIAAEQNKSALVELLIAAKNFDPHSASARKAFTAAVISGSFDTIKLLLQAGVVPSQADFQKACSQGKLDIAKELIAASEKAFDYDTALLFAVSAGNLPAVEFLVNEKGADVNYVEPPISAKATLMTPLILAIDYKHPQIARFLIEKGAIRQQAVDALSISELSFAAFIGDPVEAFIPVKYNAEEIETFRAKFGLTTALKSSSKRKNIEPHPDLNVQDRLGYTPLLRAVQNGDLQNITQLIQAGADVNVRSNDGHVALIDAVIQNNADAVEALLQVSGIDINVCEKQGAYRSAREIAVQNTNQAIVQALDQFVVERSVEFLKENRLYELNSIMDNYHHTRREQKDEYGDTKEYLYLNVLGLFQKSYKQKMTALADLKRVLRGEYFDAEGKPIDLIAHLSTLRNGRLGNDLRSFIKQGHADCIVDQPVTTVTEFVYALQAKIQAACISGQKFDRVATV